MEWSGREDLNPNTGEPECGQASDPLVYPQSGLPAVGSRTRTWSMQSVGSDAAQLDPASPAFEIFLSRECVCA